MAAGISLGEKKEVKGEIRDCEGNRIEVTTEGQVLDEMDKYREFMGKSGREWKIKEGLAAMGIDVCWFVDDFVMDIIGRYLYYEKAPHQASDGHLEKHPAVWVQSCAMLNQIFGVKL